MNRVNRTSERPYLSARYLQLIQGVIDGKRNKQIAAEIGITENTVKVYFCRLFKRLQVDGRLGVAQWARANKDRLPAFSEPAATEYATTRAIIAAASFTAEQRTALKSLLRRKRV